MPAVLCGLDSFEAPTTATAGAVAREFIASLDPALDAAGCPVEVFRLELVAADVVLAPDDTVVCRIPGWRFDCTALEELHRECEDLRAEHEKLRVTYSRAQEALIVSQALVEQFEEERICMDCTGGAAVRCPINSASTGGNAGVLAYETTRSDSSRSMLVQENTQLRQQLALTEKNQQETKELVIGVRNEFMNLVDMMSNDAGLSGMQCSGLPAVMKELDASMRSCVTGPQVTPGRSPYDLGGPFCRGGGSVASAVHSRHGSKEVATSAHSASARRPIGSPRGLPLGHPGGPAHQSQIGMAYSAHRSGGPRSRGVHPRGGHSAGATVRHHRLNVDSA